MQADEKTPPQNKPRQSQLTLNCNTINVILVWHYSRHCYQKQSKSGAWMKRDCPYMQSSALFPFLSSCNNECHVSYLHGIVHDGVAPLFLRAAAHRRQQRADGGRCKLQCLLKGIAEVVELPRFVQPAVNKAERVGETRRLIIEHIELYELNSVREREGVSS